MNQGNVGDFLSECFSKISKNLGKSKSDSPRLIFCGSNNNGEGVLFVFILVEDTGNELERLESQYSDLILLILDKLLDGSNQFIEDEFFFDNFGEFSNFLSNSSSDHGSFFSTQFGEFLSNFGSILSCSKIDRDNQINCRDSAGEISFVGGES